MTAKEILRKFCGPSLRELVEKGDFISIRNTIIFNWVMFLLLGAIFGVELVRRGLVPL